VLISCHLNAGQNYNIKVAIMSFENMVKFGYLETIVTNQNLIHDKIKHRLNLVNACCYSLQNLLFSHLLSKNLKKYTKL
jgi:hypothetical protein